MGELSRTLISQSLPPCPFCGDIHPEVKSGPCTFTKGDLYQAQVHCGHCGATGTRFCGEEDLGEAEIKAAQEWGSASKLQPGLRKQLSDANKWVFTLALGALIAVLWLPENFSATYLYGALGGSMIFGVVLGIIEARANYRDKVARWERMRERIGSQTGV
jgi:hypothetical protein